MSVLQRTDCTRRLTFQVSCFNWLLGIINNFGSIFLLLFLPQKRKLDPLKSFKYHQHQHKGNKVWVFLHFLNQLQLSIIWTQVTISHSYFLSHRRKCLFHCFSLHVDSNSPDVTEKSVNGLAPYETFRWSVVRAPRRYRLWAICSTTDKKVVARHQYGI